MMKSLLRFGSINYEKLQRIQRRFALARFGRAAHIYKIHYCMKHFVTQFICIMLFCVLQINIMRIVLTECETLKAVAPLVYGFAFTALPTRTTVELLHFARITFALSRHERGRLLDMVRPYSLGCSGLTIQARARVFKVSLKANLIKPSIAEG